MFVVFVGGNLSTDFLVKKKKRFQIILAKVPAFHRIAVGRNFEFRWHYEGELVS